MPGHANQSTIMEDLKRKLIEMERISIPCKNILVLKITTRWLWLHIVLLHYNKWVAKLYYYSYHIICLDYYTKTKHGLVPSKIANKCYISDTPPSGKREKIPIQNDYPVHAFRLELSEVRMDGHSGWMRLWFLTVVGQNMHRWPKKSHSFALNCGWNQFDLALINGSLARVLHREGDNAVWWIRALAWI